MNVPGAIPGTVPLGGLAGRGPQHQMDSQQAYEQKMVYYMNSAMESCPTKCAISGVMGFALGGMFGLFMASMRYDTPMSSPLNPGQVSAAVADLPWRQQLKIGMKDMGKSSLSSAKNFGAIGAMFSGIECCIEGLRAKNELSNGIMAGGITGGLLARKGGPQAVAIGAAGFAVFSAAIDSYMRMPSEGNGGPVE